MSGKTKRGPGDVVIPFVLFPLLLTAPLWIGWLIWYSVTTDNAVRAECESIGAVDVAKGYGPYQCVMEDGTTIIPPSRLPGGNDE